MPSSRTVIRTLSTLGSICLLLCIFSGISMGEEQEHECVMYGILSENIPNGIMVNDLLTDSKSVKYGNQSNGWGSVEYPGWKATPTFHRSAEKPSVDGQWCDFDGTCVPAGEYARVAAAMDVSKPKIALVHWRTGSSGCGGYVADAHPFYREYDGKTWSFVQNGGLSKPRARRLVIDANPDNETNDWMNDLPNSSGVLGCYPQAHWKYPEPAGGWVVGDINYMIDSELYFLLVMKHIKEAHSFGRSTLSGIVEGVVRLLNHGETSGINFIMSDGETMWAFKRGNYLNYRYNAAAGFTDVATMALTGVDINGNPTGFDNTGWVAMAEYQLVVAKKGVPPEVYDIRDLIPGNLNGDTLVDDQDLALFNIALGSRKGSANYNENADYDKDGRVTSRDYSIWKRNYEHFNHTLLCDDHMNTANGCCRDFCGGTYLTFNGSSGTLDEAAGSYWVSTDSDFFRFAAIAGITYTIDIDTTLSTTLSLYDTNGTTLLTSSTTKQIVWGCPVSGTYFVKVKSTSSYGTITGPYSLSLNVPSFTQAGIEVTPTFSRCINMDGTGTITVTVLSDPKAGFDATKLDLSSVRLNGLGVKSYTWGKNKIYYATQWDVNRDRRPDLILTMENAAASFKPDTQEAELIGVLSTGGLIEGTDAICIKDDDFNDPCRCCRPWWRPWWSWCCPGNR